MAARYTRKQARMALSFWRKKLAESLSFESEKDQEDENKDKKSDKKGKEDGEEDVGGGEDDFDLEDFMPPEGEEGGEDEDDPEAKIAELKAEIEDLKAKLAKYEGGDEEGGDDFDVGDDEEDDSDEEDSEEDDSEEDSGDKDSEKKVDESRKYRPNTVGAVIQLLEKFNPKSKLMIRMNPGKYSCMPINVSGKLSLNGHGCTYMDIAKGRPMNEAADVKLPVHMIAFLGKLARVQRRLGKGATDKDIAEKMDITVDQVKKLKEIAKQISK